MLQALRRRWDIDPDTAASLPFDRAIALVNVRRIEVACLLEFGNDLLEIALGVRVPGIVAGIPAAIIVALLSRRAQRWSLRAQQAAVIAVFIIGLLDSIWGSAETSLLAGVLISSFTLQLLSITMLFVLAPRTLATIIVGMLLVYGAVVFALPIDHHDKVAGVVNATIVSVISLVAGWLIHTSRRSDFDQKRLIRRQNAQLVEQNIELDQLMAITAHDLRSPLYGLRNLLDLAAKRGKAEGAVPGGTIREAIFSLDSMIALVTRLLDAHSAGHMPLSTVTGDDVRMHLMAAARRIAPTAEAATVRVEPDLSDAPIMAAFDRGALAQILDNLLSNAVRFSPAGGGVRLSCRAQAGRCLIAVEDEGPGFDAAGEAAMFRKFARAPDSVDGKAGSGMGLFIAATLAERMGASLAFRPAVPTGAIFTLSLPID